MPKQAQIRTWTLVVCFAIVAAAQAGSPGDAPQGRMNMGMVDMNPAGMYLMNLASGTSQNPPGWPMPMLMTHLGNWNTMFMGVAFLSDIQQSGPRGGDKLYSTNWFMAAAEHRVGASGAFETVLTLSLEPAAITDRRYPLLFQTGETAHGLPLADAQHPHNFIMGWASITPARLRKTRRSTCTSLPWETPPSGRSLSPIARRPWKFHRRRFPTIGRIPRTSQMRW